MHTAIRAHDPPRDLLDDDRAEPRLDGRSPGGTVVPLAPRRDATVLRGRDAHPSGRARPPRTDLAEEAERFTRTLIRLAGEVAAGRRPLPQLERVLAPTLLHRLAVGLRPGRERPQHLPQVGRVFVAPPSPTGAIEVTALLRDDDGRTTALAVRLEQHRGCWRATELTAPESGYAPLPTRSDPGGHRGPDAFDEAAADEVAAVALLTPRRGTA